MEVNKNEQDSIRKDLDEVEAIVHMVTGFRCETGTSIGSSTEINTIYFNISLFADENVNNSKREEVHAFNRYFKSNYSTDKGLFHFETPLKALSSILRAWYLWENHLPDEIREEYLETARKFYKSLH